MLHLPSFLDSLKWSRIKRITNENTANWKNIPLFEIQKTKLGLALTKAPGLAIDGIFWENIVHTLFHFINYSVSSFTYSIFLIFIIYFIIS